MNLIKSEKSKLQKLQKKIVGLISAMQTAENFVEGAITKAGDSASLEDTQALRANLAILKERTNEQIEKCKKGLMELRQKVA